MHSVISRSVKAAVKDEVVIEILPSTEEESQEVGTKQQASSMVGYEPVTIEGEEVAYEDAKELTDSLDIGESGENLTFDAKPEGGHFERFSEKC